MVYLATQEVVERVRPLLESLATRTIDKARLLQYLSAMAGVEWDLFDLVQRAQTDEGEYVAIRDRATGELFRLLYPECMPRSLEPLVRAEYVRLAAARPLTAMDARLFEHFYAGGYCVGCRWHGERQICHECLYAGSPVNFEPFHPEAAPPLPLEPPTYNIDML
ncbi:MAG: hypothetical protein ACR2JW_06690 [Thermomicrobiales bacterium]